jgi:hypothetical protein
LGKTINFTRNATFFRTRPTTVNASNRRQRRRDRSERRKLARRA